MGCCISKSPSRRPPKPSDSPPRLSLPSSPPRPASHPTPSPIPLEEEAVKEIVLSETPPLPPPVSTIRPLAKEDDSPPVAAIPQPPASSPRPKAAPQVFGQPPTPRKLHASETQVLISKLEEAAGVVSEYSDMYTLSGSLSVSTTATTGTVATLNDYEVTSKVYRPAARTPPNRVPRKRPPVTGGRDERSDRGAGAGPHTRRLQQPSPDRGRRGTSQGRDSGGVRRNAGQAGRDTRRRSSSPAQGRAGEGTGKSPSKRTGGAGNRSSSSSSLSGPGSGNGPSTQRSKMDPDPDRNDGIRGGGKDNDNDSAASESLENPHVSLECFIFL